MKKNRFAKTAIGLLILCLLTTCVIGTTFAKYTTGGSSSDSARVAKWGVNLTMQSNSMFSNQYTGTDDAITVKSHDDQKVVAPGTSVGVANTAAVFSISGTPEVSVKVTIELTNVKEVYLKKGTYLDETTANSTTDTFTLGSDYYPVVFKLWQTKDYTGGPFTPVELKAGTLADIQDFIDNTYNPSANYAPNTVLDSEYKITWAWDFAANDKVDTFLGNRAAGIAYGLPIAADAYNLDLSFDLSITVTQID